MRSLILVLLVGCGSADDQSAADATPDTTQDVTVDVPMDGPADSGIVDATFERGSFPQVPNVGNKVLSSPNLVTISASNDDLIASLTAFSAAVPSSKFWSSMSSEYSLGSIQSTATLIGPAMSGMYSSTQLAAYVQGVLASQDAGLAPNGDTIYLLYLPSNALFSGTFANDCGYHAPYPSTGSTGDQMAIVRRCIPNPDQETQLGELTRVAAHEIAESATDPLDQGYNLGLTPQTPWTASPWQAWVSIGHVELGDLCEGTRNLEIVDGGPEGGWEYQRIWSNAGAGSGGDPCLPPANDPYESVTAPATWYTAAANATVTIPIEGWSVAAAQPWLVYAVVINGTQVFEALTGSDFVVSSPLGVGTSGTCFQRQAMNAGIVGSITFTVPASAVSGDWGVIRIDSFREKQSPSCYQPITEDEFHFWLVGVHVP